MINRLNEHSSLLIAKKWNLVHMLVVIQSTLKIVYNLEHKLFLRIRAPIILHVI